MLRKCDARTRTQRKARLLREKRPRESCEALVSKTLSLPLGSASWRSSETRYVGGANWAGAGAWADAGPIARFVWRWADERRVVKGNVLGGGLVRGRDSTRAERGRNYCTGGVFSLQVGRHRGGAWVATDLADWEHAGRKRVAGGGGTG